MADRGVYFGCIIQVEGGADVDLGESDSVIEVIVVDFPDVDGLEIDVFRIWVARGPEVASVVKESGISGLVGEEPAKRARTVDEPSQGPGDASDPLADFFGGGADGVSLDK